MANTANSDGETMPEPLHFLIRHIFLPPCPSARNEANRERNESELMQTVHDALTLFRASLDAEQSQLLDRCTRMLKCMIDAHSGEDTRLDTRVLKQQMGALEDNGTFTPSKTQNADRQHWCAAEHVEGFVQWAD